jgi:hypothetical protein
MICHSTRHPGFSTPALTLARGGERIAGTLFQMSTEKTEAEKAAIRELILSERFARRSEQRLRPRYEEPERRTRERGKLYRPAGKVERQQRERATDESEDSES